MEQPASDFDGAWKYALEQAFAPFLALFFPVVHAAIDWQQPVVFQDTKLQQLVPEDSQGKQRVDKLVQVQRLDGSPAQVLIHVEIQSQREVVFAERMFVYHARLFDRTRHPVVSLAILGDEEPGWRPDRFVYGLWGCDLELRFPIVKLRDLDVAYLAATRHPFAVFVLLYRDAQETRGNPDARARRKIARYRALLRQGYPRDDVRLLVRLMEHVLRLDPERARVVRDALRQVEQEELGMETFVTSFEEIGREEGQRALVLRLLTRKFGELPPEVQTQIVGLTPEQVLALSDALLDFQALDDLITWLAQPPA